MEGRTYEKRTYELKKPKFLKIHDLKPGVHGYNIYAKVVEVKTQELTKLNGEKLVIAEGVLGDDSGVINFRIVGDHAAKLAKDKVIAVRNGRSEVFQEHMRVEIDRWGKISEETHTIEKIHNALNLSAQAYQKKVAQKDSREGNRRGNRNNRN